jgi:hypothetical protein
MKLCVDCMYFIVNGSKCGARQLPDPVRGIPRSPDANIERAVSYPPEACGPDARNFRVIPLVAAA